MTASVTVTNSVDAELSGRAVTTAVIASVVAHANSVLLPTTANISVELRNDNNNNNNSYNKYTTTIMNVFSNNNSSTLNMLSAAASSIASSSMNVVAMQPDNVSFAYDESPMATEQDAINRSFLLLTTAVTSVTATAAATTNDTHQQQIVHNVSDEDWAHFYDLILSWQGICLIAVFCTFIVITIIGNTLVILAVITTRRLKTVTNCFVMSLAVADLLVGIFVMPPAVAVHLIGSWQLGWILCDIWISLDILLCTASILSLCAISVDRYLAVTQPLTYSRKRRSKRLALIMILIVWVLALVITCPPMLGWYEPGRRDLSECRYNQNEGYVIFSAMGSFFIPMAVMIYVYARISCVIASRHDNMTDISVHNKKFKRYTSADVENDIDHELSEQELSSGQKKQAAARTLSTQTIAKELHEVMLSEGENGGNCSLLGLAASTTTTLSAGTNPKNGCYELTRPASFKRTPTASSTMTTLTSEQQHWSFSGIGPGAGSGSGGSATATDGVQLQKQQLRQHSVRHHSHHHLSAGGAGGILVASPNMDSSTTPASYTTRNTRVHHHHHHHHSKSLSNRITSLKKENKTTQTLSIVVGGFIACWLPFFVYYLITPFLENHQVSRTLAKGLTWLGWFNSAINPFIYAFYSVDFRAAFWRLTCKRFFSASSMKPQFPSNTMSIRR